MGFAALLAAADRAALSHLGDSLTYSPRDGERVGESFALTGVLDATGVKVDLPDGSAVTYAPKVFVLLADLPGDPDEDDPLIAVRGVEYTVRETQKDGQGGVLLVLREAE